MTPDELTCRRVIPDDINALIELGLASYGQYANELSPENLELLQRNIAKTETWQNIVGISVGFVCVTDGNRIVGMAFLVPSGNAWDVFDNEWSYLRMVGVHPEFQGIGIARQLTMQCINHAKTTGERFIALHTSEIMHAARHIYEQCGFTILKEIPSRLGVRYWLYLMEL